MTQKQSKPNYIQKNNIKVIMDILRISSSADQGDCTTVSHRPPTIEVHTTKSESQNRLISETEANKKSPTNKGKTKKQPSI